MEKDYSKYLLEEKPITFHSTLACAIGINEAILLQKINLWLNCKPHNSERKSWIYNTYKSWQEQLPFFSESTIKRAIKNLCDRNILLKNNFNKSKLDNTNWYSINYQKLDEIVEKYKKSNADNLKIYDIQMNGQTEIIDSVKLTQSSGQNEQTNTNDYYTMNNNNKEIYKESFETFYEAYPRKVGKANVEKWFKKNNPNKELMNKIMLALEEHKKLKQWQDKQYIPHPATWLNQKRWEDELDDKVKIVKIERKYNNVGW